MKDSEAQVVVSRSEEPGSVVKIAVVAGDQYALIHMTKDTALSVAETIMTLLAQGDA